MAIDPVKSSIGRRVVYTEYAGAKIERGIVTSFNPSWVFVQYDGESFSKATDCARLDYEEDFLARHR